MKHLIIYTFALFALAFGCAERAQEQNFRVERDTVPLGLRVIPGQSWALWSPTSDSAFNLLSQNFSAEQERILNDDSLRAWIGGWVDDSVTHTDVSNYSQRASVVAFNDTLTFASNRYLQSYTATDSITFTVDTTNQFYGAWTIAKIDFDTAGYAVIFEAPAFDTIQAYNIVSGRRITGTHIIYFENTPYGVAISMPTYTSADAY